MFIEWKKLNREGNLLGEIQSVYIMPTEYICICTDDAGRAKNQKPSIVQALQDVWLSSTYHSSTISGDPM